MILGAWFGGGVVCSRAGLAVAAARPYSYKPIQTLGSFEMNCASPGKWTRSGGSSRGQRQKAAVKSDSFQQPSKQNIQEVTEISTSC